MPHPADAEPDFEPPRSTGWRGFILLGVLALGLAFAARYLWIESSEMGLACAALPQPKWCLLRQALIGVHLENGWGLTALAAGMVALVCGWRPAMALGLAAGLIGLVLYNAGLAAVGLLLTLLALARR